MSPGGRQYYLHPSSVVEEAEALVGLKLLRSYSQLVSLQRLRSQPDRQRTPALNHRAVLLLQGGILVVAESGGGEESRVVCY